MTIIKNATPHKINVFLSNGSVKTIEPCGKVPRIEFEECFVRTINDIDIVTTISLGLIDTPNKEPNTLFIVSRVVASFSNRTDFIVPNNLVRDNNNKIIGCRNFTFIEE